MAIQFVTIKCPECSADLQIEDGREYAFCTYCGAKVMITNDNEHIYRTIDEARIKQAETDRMVKLKQLDMEEKSSVSKKALTVLWIVVTLLLIIFGIIGMSIDNDGMGMCLLLAMCVGPWGAIGLFAAGKKKKKIVNENEVSITTAMMDCVDYHYNKAVILYKNAGFTNINAIPLHDLTRFNMKKEGMVESITINGEDDFDEDEAYPKNANILITYHSK